MDKKPVIPDINYHLTSKCNMTCKYCFARFQAIPELGKKDSLEIVKKIAKEARAFR